MKRSLKIVAALFALVFAAALAVVILVALRVESPPPKTMPADAAVYDDHYMGAAEEATRILSGAMTASHLPSASIAVGVNGELAFTLAMGYADLDSATPASAATRYRVGSVAKAFTGAALGVLLDQGRLSLDDVYQRWVPDFPVKAYAFTLRDLASHQAGVRHHAPGLRGLSETYHQIQYDSVRDALSLVEDDPLLFEPGTSFNYSSFGYNMLSLALERAAGMPYLELMRLTIFEPLGMRDTLPDHQDSAVANVATPYLVYDDTAIRAPGVNNSYKWAGGGFLSTPADMVAFGNGLLADRVVTTATRARLWTPQRLADGTANPEDYALGFRVSQTDDGRHVSHGGGSVGGSAYLVILPKRRVVVGFATNSTSLVNASHSASHDIRADIDRIAVLFAERRARVPHPPAAETGARY